MFNPLKTKTRIKILFALLLSILVSFFFIKPKINDIPVLPQSFHLTLTQESEANLELKDITIENVYPPDYQTELQDNYYQIEIKKGTNTLYTGKMLKQRIIIAENLDGEPYNKTVVENYGEFDLYVPYYKIATSLTITQDNGEEALYVDLTSKELTAPKLTNTCGDGICTDNENLLMCYTDCKYLLPRWLPK